MEDRVRVYEYKERQEYINIQIGRSKSKFSYCKVYFLDVVRYRRLLNLHALSERAAVSNLEFHPILCLGVRSGAELDLFRAAFLGPLMRLPLVQQIACRLDRNKEARRKIRLARWFGIGSGQLDDGRVRGVELNPECRRPDVYTGSFDELPLAWSGRFRLIFSNSFDHSIDPARTVREWRRVSVPGAYVIIAYVCGIPPSATDPVGSLSLSAVTHFWQAPIVFASETFNRNGYHEVCFRL